MKKYGVFILQGLSIPFGIAVFSLLRMEFNKFDSFVFAMMAYWTFLVVATIISIRVDREIGKNLFELLGPTKSFLFSALAFIPALGVFFVAALPILGSLKLVIMIAGILIGSLNGILEEIFWRGLAIANLKEFKNHLFVASISLVLFAVFHFSFLMLSLNYQGGAINLVASALLMGALWYFVGLKTGTIKYGIFAHQLVNAFAFSSLFVLNGI